MNNTQQRICNTFLFVIPIIGLYLKDWDDTYFGKVWEIDSWFGYYVVNLVVGIYHGVWLGILVWLFLAFISFILR